MKIYEGSQIGDFPVSKSISKRIFSIPMHPYLDKHDLNQIINIILTYFE